MAEKIKMKLYDGPLIEKLRQFYDVYSERLEVAEYKSIQCSNYVSWHEKYQAYETRPTDVWVVSYPKAGTTWTQEMVWCILNDLEDEKSKEILMKRFPFFEWDSILPEDSGSIPKMEEGNPCNPGETWKVLHTIEDPRTIKSHLHMNLLPENIWTSKAKIIYVCRDPRDVCVSYYFHSVKLDGFRGKFDDFFELFVSDVAFYSPFWKHVLDFWEKKDQENVMFIRYEDLNEDLPGIIRKAAKFLGKEISDKYVEKMKDHLSFAKMSSNKAVNNESIVSMNNEEAAGIKFMRKGKVGDWESHFSKDQIEMCKKWTEEKLKNSDFPYYRDYA